MNLAQAIGLAPARAAARSLADWFIMALLCLATLLAVGLLTAAPLGPDAIQMSLAAAFIASTVGGLIVALLARAPGEFAAPAASTTVIYASLGADLIAHGSGRGGVLEVWAAMSVAVVLMGMIMLAAGWLRLAGFVKFMPSPVTAGFVTGVGMLVVWSQVGPILGVESSHGMKLGELWPQVKTGSVIVGAATIVALIAVPRFKRLGPPALTAVFAGTIIYHLLSTLTGAATLGNTLSPLQPVAAAVHTATTVWSGITPAWVAKTALQVLPYAALIALQAIMNAAVTGATLSSLLGERSNVNRTLMAQGCANIVCGLLGALPVCTTATLVMASIRLKGKHRTMAAGMAIVLFVFVLLAGRWLSLLPVAVLAALLLMAGVGTVNQSTVRLIKAAWSARSKARSTWLTLGIAIVVAAALFWGTVPLALTIGAVLAMVLLAIELSAATRFSAQASAQMGSRRVWPPQQANWLRENQSHIAVFRPQGALFFGTADQLSKRLASTPQGTRFCVLDLARVPTIDASACEIIANGAKALAARGVKPLLAGLRADDARGRSLVALGLSSPDPRTAWFADLDRALEHAETALLSEQWPGMDGDAGFDFAQTPLTQGMSEDELRELRHCMKPLDVAAGPLFRHGEAGSSMYIVEHGQVEIRIEGAGAASHARLAAYGPGSIFGEMSMVMSQQRTADAHCVTPARLLELDRRSLDELESRSPHLYGKVMRNLSVHIAKRLDLATGLIRGLQ